jgi:hypothetical protein
MRPGPKTVPALSAEDWPALKDAVRRCERAWHGAPRPRIDDYLPAGGPLRARALVELAHIDLELRLKAGEGARVEEYLARYPELAGDRAAGARAAAVGGPGRGPAALPGAGRVFVAGVSQPGRA